MTPTAQNIANLEADMRQLAGKMVAGGYDATSSPWKWEKLVRAYDPRLLQRALSFGKGARSRRGGLRAGCGAERNSPVDRSAESEPLLEHGAPRRLRARQFAPMEFL